MAGCRSTSCGSGKWSGPRSVAPERIEAGSNVLPAGSYLVECVRLTATPTVIETDKPCYVLAALPIRTALTDFAGGRDVSGAVIRGSAPIGVIIVMATPVQDV